VNVTKTSFEGLLIIEPKVFGDSRGFFFESYNRKTFHENGIVHEFLQDNQSRSQRGVLRGLHFQSSPFSQTKLVRVLDGTIQDVVVDLRKEQPTFGKSYSIDLSFDNKKQLLVPKGFAHGFLVLSESADVLYKCDDYYHPEAEGGVRFDDIFFKIDWRLPYQQMIFADKDLRYPPFQSE
jgi:dTDP-4-dehydrorhamnose 3,5-epimerase